jgi:hypothetical protein
MASMKSAVSVMFLRRRSGMEVVRLGPLIKLSLGIGWISRVTLVALS